ncbi:MAG: ACT domain-containing protein [Candidatus Micrarchaeota archaeon]
MRELTIVTENKVGALADICEALGNNGINISSISAHGYRDKGVVRLVTSDEKSARNALEKLGVNVTVGDLLIVTIPDKPGELAKLTRKLSNSGVNIDGIYLLGKANGNLEVGISAEDNARASCAVRK